MATINSLPAELLRRILEFGPPFHIDHLNTYPSERYAFLKAASLVSRA